MKATGQEKISQDGTFRAKSRMFIPMTFDTSDFKFTKRVNTLACEIERGENSARSSSKICRKIPIICTKSTKELTLTFDEKLLDKDLNFLSHGFKRLPSLQKIYLKFRQYHQLTDIGFLYLSQGLKKLGSLQNLTLDISISYNMTDAGLSYLSKAFKKTLLAKGNPVFLWRKSQRD